MDYPQGPFSDATRLARKRQYTGTSTPNFKRRKYGAKPYKRATLSARDRAYLRAANRRKGARGNIVRQLRKQVTVLAKSVKSDQAVHTHRRRDIQDIGSNVGQVNHVALTGINLTTLEASMANLRYYDPANPSVLVTADAATGTYTRQVHFTAIYQKLHIRNNYQIPARVTIYSCTPKNDTSIEPPGFYSNGASDQTISMAVTSPLLYMSDINMVRDNWRLKVVKEKLLQAGEEMWGTYSVKGFDYDPSNADSHTLAYQRKYGAHVFVVRIEGTIGHDQQLAQYDTTQAKVDTILDTKFVITYDAGVNLTDFSSDNNASGTFTNFGVVSSMPVADNIAWSQS